MMERKCISESETRRNRLSVLVTYTVPLTNLAAHRNPFRMGRSKDRPVRF